MTTDRSPPAPSYVLGHSPRELERLARQARLIEPITREIFIEAGIAPGMRVLDIGSGAGDVAFLAAELVGPKGEVVGTDLSSTALANARTRAKERARRTSPSARAIQRRCDSSGRSMRSSGAGC